jgi:hypothetical protein
MKRVVIEPHTSIIDANSCMPDSVYIMKTEYNDRYILSRIGHKVHLEEDSYQWQYMDVSFTVANGMNTCKTHEKCISQSLEQGHEVYQFPTFRAAMQYYIEQTKEAEGE